MNGNTRLIGIALIGVAALQFPLNADAACSTDVTFGAYYSYVVGTSNGPSLRANFWVLGHGNPTIGEGVDNGIDSNWIFSKGPSTVVQGTWGSFFGDSDGCPNSLPDPGATSMVVSLSDVNAAGNMTYAVICATRSTQTHFDYSMDFPPGCSGSDCVWTYLVVAPQAMIANIVRINGTNDVLVTVASPSFGAGFYGDGSPNCTVANAIPQYDVYMQQVARGAFPNPSPDAGPWVLTATCNIGSSCTPPAITSPTNTDIYMAVSPHFNSNFTTGEAATGAPARVGLKSTMLQAGPILADPPRPRIMPKPRRDGL